MLWFSFLSSMIHLPDLAPLIMLWLSFLLIVYYLRILVSRVRNSCNSDLSSNCICSLRVLQASSFFFIFASHTMVLFSSYRIFTTINYISNSMSHITLALAISFCARRFRHFRGLPFLSLPWSVTGIQASHSRLTTPCSYTILLQCSRWCSIP